MVVDDEALLCGRGVCGARWRRLGWTPSGRCSPALGRVSRHVEARRRRFELLFESRSLASSSPGFCARCAVCPLHDMLKVGDLLEVGLR